MVLGFWFLVVGCEAFGFWFWVSDFWFLVFGCWLLVVGCWVARLLGCWVVVLQRRWSRGMLLRGESTSFTSNQSAQGLQPETLCASQRDPPCEFSFHKSSLIAPRVSTRTVDGASVRKYKNVPLRMRHTKGETGCQPSSFSSSSWCGCCEGYR